MEAEAVSLARPEPGDSVRGLGAFTRFRADLSEPGAGEGVAQQPDSLAWAQSELARRVAVAEAVYQFEPAELAALHARFSAALIAAEELFDAARRERSGAGYGRTFDFEIVLPADAGVREAFFCQQWLKLRGRPATLVAPFLATADEARLHAAVARHFGSTLSFDADTLARLGHPSQWTGSRWNCRITGGEITASRVQAVATALRA